MDLTFVVGFDGWVEDLERFHASAVEHLHADWELVVVDNPVDAAGSELIGSLDRVRHVPLRDAVGYGAGRNIGLRKSRGRIVCVVDTSVEIEGDLELGGIFADPEVGLIGRWGVVVEGDHHFVPSQGPDVDGVEGYFIAMRRADLSRTGLFDPKFRFYRNADIDFSFQVRDAGLRTIVDATLPIARHEHRLWENTPERDDLSRKNFGRFRQHWGNRPDLITHR